MMTKKRSTQQTVRDIRKATCYHYLVNMVWHKAIRPYLRPRLPAKFRYEFNLVAVIVFTEKSFLTPISSLGHMMRIIWNYYSSHPGHCLSPI